MRSRFVAIIGGSGSGKTWLADRLAAHLGPRASRLCLDDFYRDRAHLTLPQRKRINFDHPRAIDWPLFIAAVESLKLGQKVSVPHYDFTQSTRSGKTQTSRPKPWILVDGLWLLQKRECRRLMDFSIFVDCPARIRLERRLARDLKERARSEASVRRQFREHTEPMHQRFVQPQSKLATFKLKSPVSDADVQTLAAHLDNDFPSN
jgi:uridine kinase